MPAEIQLITSENTIHSGSNLQMKTDELTNLHLYLGADSGTTDGARLALVRTALAEREVAAGP